MKKFFKTGALAIMAALILSSTAYAGTWKQTDGRWWYQNDDGSYPANGWQWIDSNNDGVAESYYFDAAGWMLANTVTPDGYTVDANGAWTENGVIQTKNVGVQQVPAQETAPETVPAAVPAAAPAETSSEFAAFYGTYTATNPEFIMYVGLDDSWKSVTVSAGNPIAINRIDIMDAEIMDGYVICTIPGTNCGAFIFSNGSMSIYHLAGADSVSYQKK